MKENIQMEVRPEESALVGVSGTYNCADTCYVLLIHSGENIWDQSVCVENNALFRNSQSMNNILHTMFADRRGRLTCVSISFQL